MRKYPLLYGVIGALIGSAGVWLLLANTNAMMGMRGQNMMGNTSDNRSAMMGNLDQHFIEQMIPHHEDAISMAKLALEKSKRPEIRNLAEDIQRTQSEEITKMSNWYKSWFGKDVPKSTTGMGMMGNGMMAHRTDIETLRAASDFDKAFLAEMIPHHQMAVMMASMLARGTNRNEMQQLAQDIVTAQSKEIDQMRQWQKDWGY